MCSGSGQHGNVCADDAPSLGEFYPNLALPAKHLARRRFALKLQRNAAKIAPKAHNIEPFYRSREVGRGPGFAEMLKFVSAVEGKGATA